MFIIDNKFKKIFNALRLDKPLVIFDTEATGLNISTDKIVEIAYLKIFANGTTKEEDIFLNPEINISPEASAVHGITNDDVKDKPKFRDVAQGIWEDFNDCYYGGYNIRNFDLPLLRREFVRVGMDFDYNAGMIVDTREIFRFMTRRSLSFAYQYYCGKNLKLGHTAPLNVQVATDILVKQIDKYKEVIDMEFIKKTYKEEDDYLDKTRKFYWLHGDAYLAFSKYKNKSLIQVAKEDPAFLQWILDADFSKETKDVVRKAIAELDLKK